MTSLLKALFATIVFVLLIGCAPKERIVPVTVVETIVVAPPKAMMAKETVPTPGHTPEEFSKATPKEQANMLDKLIGSLYLALSVANQKLLKLNSWTEEQKQLYDKKPLKGVQNE